MVWSPASMTSRNWFCFELSEERAERCVVGQKDIISGLGAPGYMLELQAHSQPTSAQGLLCGQDQCQAHTGRRMTPGSWAPAPSCCLLAGMIFVAFLLLPLKDELGSQLPPILHVSLGQKLVVAYILGLLTVVFLRTWALSSTHPTHPLLRGQGRKQTLWCLHTTPSHPFPSVSSLLLNKHPGI